MISEASAEAAASFNDIPGKGIPDAAVRRQAKIDSDLFGLSHENSKKHFDELMEAKTQYNKIMDPNRKRTAEKEERWPRKRDFSKEINKKAKADADAEGMTHEQRKQHYLDLIKQHKDEKYMNWAKREQHEAKEEKLREHRNAGKRRVASNRKSLVKALTKEYMQADEFASG